MSRMPAQKPGRSKQDYQTPSEFLEAVKSRLHIPYFECDLAASDTNAVCGVYYTERDDSLSDACSWVLGGHKWCWLNPPFSNITPWVMKACKTARVGAHVAMLVPASTGANWWRHWVDGEAHVLLLNGRITFVGAEDPYPKDCALLLYTPHTHGGYEVWPWT